MSEDSGFSFARIIKRFAIVVVVGSVVCTLLLTIFQRKLLFPVHAIPHLAAEIPADAETWFTETDTPIEVWFLPSLQQTPKSGVVFFAHGNGGLIDHFPRALRPYRKLGFHVVLVEYRGYGRSKGSPNQDEIVSDIVRVYDRVSQRDDVDMEQVVFHGQSIGGGVIAAVARERTPTRLILESTFTSVRDIAYDILPPFWLLVLDPFETHEVVASLDIPVLVMHGTRDGIVPFRHGETLAKLAQRATFVTFEEGHMIRWNSRYWETIRTFLAQPAADEKG